MRKRAGTEGARAAFFAAILAAFAVSPARAADRFVDSDEYKGKEYKTGCVITDYADMTSGDGVNWVWLDPSAKLAGGGTIEIVPVKNISDVTDATLAGTVEADWKQAFERVGKSVGKGGLKLSSCVYWVERANTAKMFIPFAGGHLAQAGVGIELVVTDASGKPVAKIRHDGRNGSAPSDAAAEVVDDVVNFTAKH